MTVRLLVGDCRETLPTLAPGSVQAVVTSPPYYGLRDYGLPPLVWGGDANHAHEWSAAARFSESSVRESRAGLGTQERARWLSSGVCPCGAWLGSLGLEPTPDLFVEHLVEVFRHVKRVLRDDSVLWLNLGDSYAGSGKGPSNSVQGEASQIGPSAIKKHNTAQFANGQAPTSWIPTPSGLKPKDLMMMPFRVAMALQADGWWLRSVIPWLKRNSMPESVTDRPATSVEYVFLLAKSARYFWNADAVRQSGQPWSTKKPDGWDTGDGAHGTIHRLGRETGKSSGEIREGRNRRNSDWWFESWQGFLLDEQDDPLALVVNPAPFSGAHFATFPAKLVEPMVKASTRPGDTVLDPFAGAGTVGLVADRLQRNAILCELKPAYAEMGTQRITADAPMFTEVSGVEPSPYADIIDKQAALGKRTYSGFNARWDAKEASA